jgi:hypothetical protein
VSFLGPLPDTPKTYVDATLGHLESALSFGRLLAEKVEALETENARLRGALLEYGRHKDDCVFWQDDESDLEAYGEGGCCTCGFVESKWGLTKELGDE